MNEFSSIVVSLALVLPKVPENFAAETILASLDKSFQYYELLVVLNPGQGVEQFEQTLTAHPNTRCIIMSAAAPEDVLRKKAIEAAIGDQVVLWNMEEAAPEYIPILVRSNIAGHDFSGLVFSARDNSLYGMGSQIFTVALNKLTGYSLNSRLSSVGCYSRTMVNAVNSMESDMGSMKLLIASLGFRHAYIEGASVVRRGFAQAAKRLSDSLEIIGSVPHKLLRATAWASLLSCAACLAYIIYVCCVWLAAPAVQPGWTTTSLVMSAFFSIVFFAVFIFSCIFLNRLKFESHERYSIARESAGNDFIKTFSELNITDKHE